VIKPTLDYVLVADLETSDTSAGGVFIPEDAREKHYRAMVIDVGPGVRGKSGELIKLEVEPGDTVLYSKFGGTAITWEGEEFILLREQDIFAKVIE